MNSTLTKIVLSTVTAVTLAGCVEAPRRAHYDDSYYQRRAQYDCSRCGVIRDVDRVYVRERESHGGGAVLGAIIGGVLGSTIGKGDGRTAATVGGAVAGGFAGDAIERNSSDRGDRQAWQFHVQLDDGRWATVTQWDDQDLRPGDRVIIREDRLMRLR